MASPRRRYGNVDANNVVGDYVALPFAAGEAKCLPGAQLEYENP